MFERTYGIDFPFRDSRFGTYLRLTETADQEIRASLLHLILTRKGSRYYLPEFGTRLYEFIFEPFDNITFAAIESDIRDAVEKFLPNLTITNISVEPAEKELENPDVTTNPEEFSTDSRDKIYRVPGKGTSEYTAKVRIDYSITNNVFSQSDFVIINL